METYVVTAADAGKRLDRFVAEKRPDLTRLFILKALRLKKIRRNGARAEGGDRLAAGDTITCAVLAPAPVRTDGFSVVYEDDCILIADKRPGIPCEDRTGRETNTLEAQVGRYLAKKGESAFLCHRIDRNTEGLVVLAKDEKIRGALDAVIRDRLLSKSYLCVVVGQVQPRSGQLVGQIFKDAKKNRVYVTDHPVKGSKTAVTAYEVLDRRGELTLVKCRLLTGRTHQIRAQMAAAGWPILGDEKYGDREANRRWRERRQLLAAYALGFDVPSTTPGIGYLAGRRFCMKQVGFREKYFGRN